MVMFIPGLEEGLGIKSFSNDLLLESLNYLISKLRLC